MNDENITTKLLDVQTYINDIKNEALRGKYCSTDPSSPANASVFWYYWALQVPATAVSNIIPEDRGTNLR